MVFNTFEKIFVITLKLLLKKFDETSKIKEGILVSVIDDVALVDQRVFSLLSSIETRPTRP